MKSVYDSKIVDKLSNWLPMNKNIYKFFKDYIESRKEAFQNLNITQDVKQILHWWMPPEYV